MTLMNEYLNVQFATETLEQRLGYLILSSARLLTRRVLANCINDFPFFLNIFFIVILLLQDKTVTYKNDAPRPFRRQLRLELQKLSVACYIPFVSFIKKSCTCLICTGLFVQ